MYRQFFLFLFTTSLFVCIPLRGAEDENWHPSRRKKLGGSLGRKKRFKKRDCRCKECNVKFTKFYNLKVHGREQHSEVGKAECPICFRQFDRYWNLKEHSKKVHTDTEPLPNKGELPEELYKKIFKISKPNSSASSSSSSSSSASNLNDLVAAIETDSSTLTETERSIIRVGCSFPKCRRSFSSLAAAEDHCKTSHRKKSKYTIDKNLQTIRKKFANPSLYMKNNQNEE